jgi:lysozyme
MRELRPSRLCFQKLCDVEKLRLSAYRDAVGVWTIGYGHTGPEVIEGLTISKAQAEKLLVEDLARFAKGVAKLLTRGATQNQFDAMCMLAFNIGLGRPPNGRGREGFRQSTVLRLHNEGNFAGAAQAFLLWSKGRDPNTGALREMRGLIARRTVEMQLYLTPGEEERLGAYEELSTSPAAVTSEGDSFFKKIPVVATGAATAAGVAREVMTQVEIVWGTFWNIGLNPYIVSGALMAVGLGAVAWFLWDQWRKYKAGRS